jgi:hypothetical protein
MFYTFFASGDLQVWASNTTDEHQHVLNNSVSSRDTSQHAGINESNNINDLTDRLRAEIRDDNHTIE